jgi:hypothetical protein
MEKARGPDGEYIKYNDHANYKEGLVVYVNPAVIGSAIY